MSAANKSRPADGGLPTRQVVALCATNFSQGIMLTLPFTIAVYMVRIYGIDAGFSGEEVIGRMTGLLAASYSFAQFTTGLIWGIVSNHMGRKPVLVIGHLASTFSLVWFGLAPSYWWAAAARAAGGFLNGITGAWKCMLGESYSTLQQGRFMSYMSLAWGLGNIAGPALGGALAQHCQVWQSAPLCGPGELFVVRPYLLPCLVAAASSLLSALLVAALAEETLPSKRRRRGRSYALLASSGREHTVAPPSAAGTAEPIATAVGRKLALWGFKTKAARGSWDTSNGMDKSESYYLLTTVDSGAASEPDLPGGRRDAAAADNRDGGDGATAAQDDRLQRIKNALASVPATDECAMAAGSGYADGQVAANGHGQALPVVDHGQPLLLEMTSLRRHASENAGSGLIDSAAVAAEQAAAAGTTHAVYSYIANDDDLIVYCSANVAGPHEAVMRGPRAGAALAHSSSEQALLQPPGTAPIDGGASGNSPSRLAATTRPPVLHCTGDDAGGRSVASSPNRRRVLDQNDPSGPASGTRCALGRCSPGDTSVTAYVELQPQLLPPSPFSPGLLSPEPADLPPWYRNRQVLLNISGYGMVAFLFCALDELLPIFASAPIVEGGLSMSEMDLAGPLAFGGMLLMAYSLWGYPVLQRRVGTLQLCRLGLAVSVFQAMLMPLPSLFVARSPAASSALLYASMVIKIFAGCNAFTGTIILLNAATPRSQLGSVNGVGQTLASLVRGLGPALAGVLWGAFLGLKLPGQQFLSFAAISTVAMAAYGIFWFVRVNDRTDGQQAADELQHACMDEC